MPQKKKTVSVLFDDEANAIVSSSSENDSNSTSENDSKGSLKGFIVNDAEDSEDLENEVLKKRQRTSNNLRHPFIPVMQFLILQIYIAAVKQQR